MHLYYKLVSLKSIPILYGILLATCFFSCQHKESNKVKDQHQINQQLSKLSLLLQDAAFAVSVAKGQDSAYYTSQGKAVPDFSDNKETIKKSFKDEKIATNIAGFYALECGIGALIQQKNGTPVEWLTKIVNNKLDSGDILLLNRFANASWKAGQPFRSLLRIKKDNFIPANFLSESETKKDYDQVRAAAFKLLDSLKDISSGSKEQQFKKIGGLMKDKQFAFEMAKYMEASYYSGLNKPVPAFTAASEDSVMIDKSVFEEKVATNIAGFYALECGLNYLVTSQQKLPSEILQSIVDGKISEKDKELLERFANVTWKAGQPFRSLDRITRDIFTPFYFLSKEEIEKDWIQIITIAKMLIKKL